MDGELASVLSLKETKAGIPWCVNCIGMNPSDAPSLVEFWERLHRPHRVVAHKHMQAAKLIGEYKNKSCMLCGRSYDENGVLDESWKITAQRVKEEFQNAGLFGIDDKKVEMVVAQCRKSFKVLLANRFRIPRERWQYLTFSGQLAYMITVAQETRAKKLHGMVQL